MSDGLAFFCPGVYVIFDEGAGVTSAFGTGVRIGAGATIGAGAGFAAGAG